MLIGICIYMIVLLDKLHKASFSTELEKNMLEFSVELFQQCLKQQFIHTLKLFMFGVIILK